MIPTECCIKKYGVRQSYTAFLTLAASCSNLEYYGELLGELYAGPANGALVRVRPVAVLEHQLGVPVLLRIVSIILQYISLYHYNISLYHYITVHIIIIMLYYLKLLIIVINNINWGIVSFILTAY